MNGESDTGSSDNVTSKDESASYVIISYSGKELPKQYEPMLYSKYLHSLRHGSKFYKRIDQSAYFNSHSVYFTSLLARAYAVVRLAVLSDDHDIAIGWALADRNIVHYVYVNDYVRRTGIATALLMEPFDTISHATDIIFDLWPKKCPEVKFNPYS